MNQNLPQLGRLQQVNIHQLSDKCKSKKEVYHFLQQDCNAFLPKIQATNIYFLKQIMRGTKEYIKRDGVKVSAVPHIEGLTVEDFLQYAQQSQNLLKYLPDERDWVHLDRQWICDLLYTLDKDGIQRKINNALKERKDKLEHNRDLLIEMKPEFVQALNNCLTFSHERGRASNLLKVGSKRKRTREEIQQVKEEENLLKQNKQEYLQQVKRLKQDKDELQLQLEQVNQANQELAALFDPERQQLEVVQYQI